MRALILYGFAVSLALASCGDDTPFLVRDAAVAYSQSYCDKYEFCAPGGYSRFEGQCVERAEDVLCASMDCDAVYERGLGMLRDCQADVEAQGCRLWAWGIVPASCYYAFEGL